MHSQIIEANRKKLDRITEELVQLAAERKTLAHEIHDEKRRLGMPIADAEREKEILKNARKLSEKYGANAETVEEILFLLIADAKRSIRNFGGKKKTNAY